MIWAIVQLSTKETQFFCVMKIIDGGVLPEFLIDQVAMDDYYDFEIVNTISTADWILLLLIISSWLFLEKNIYY